MLLLILLRRVKMKIGNYYTAKSQIKKLNTTEELFYDEVRKIVGYYDDVFWEDWDIKNLQRIADAQYSKLFS